MTPLDVGIIWHRPLTDNPFTFSLYLVVVDGRLYTDDEPYWECLLEEGKTYDVAYRSMLLFNGTTIG